MPLKDLEKLYNHVIERTECVDLFSFDNYDKDLDCNFRVQSWK